MSSTKSLPAYTVALPGSISFDLLKSQSDAHRLRISQIRPRLKILFGTDINGITHFPCEERYEWHFGKRYAYPDLHTW